MKLKQLFLVSITVIFFSNNANARYLEQMRRYEYVSARPAVVENVYRNAASPSITSSQYKDGMNLYEYVRSNPVINVDPKGLESCGYKVDCGDIHVDSWWDRIGDSLGGYHCDLNNTSKPNERENARSYPVWVDRDKTCNRTLMGGEKKGKACLCATCSDITDCVDAVWKKVGQGKTPTLYDNCHTWAAAQISRCCLKTNWDPPWFAGDFTCTKWAYVGGPIMRRICIERSPSIN